MSQNSHLDYKFVATEPLGKSGQKGERQVWQTVKKIFAERECLAYWRYPIFCEFRKVRKEPDILIADIELGLIVIEVKSITIDHLSNAKLDGAKLVITD